MKCNSDYHADICPARRRNGDCVSKYTCRHKVEPPKPKTNADHYRSATDEELRDLLLEGFAEKVCPNGCDGCDGDCEGRMLNWLKQPYKEDS